MKLNKLAAIDVIYPYLFTIVIVVFAAALGMVWVTFYPVVMMVALCGGLLCGLLPSYLETANSVLDLLENCEFQKLISHTEDKSRR